MRLPDFIIGGAPRSGTTWLYVLADKHPEIEMAKPVTPEPKFFLVDELYEKGLGYYSDKWFRDISEKIIAGEKSTNYLENPAVAARIYRCLPDVRLVFTLRNPANRAYSNYKWSQQNGFETECFARALELEEVRERRLTGALRYSRPHAYFSRGLYYKLLLPFIQIFPREHILVLRYEDIVSRPTSVAESLHQFLGIEPRPQDVSELGRINATIQSDDKSDITPELRSYLWTRYEEPNEQLYGLLGPNFCQWKQ